MRNAITTCGQAVGSGLGGVTRTCRMPTDHPGRHTDLPFLTDLREAFPKVAQKIERDSFQTRGASWGQNADGQQARRNRQPRWTLRPGDSFYPRHHQTYAICLDLAADLTVQAYEMHGAPDYPQDISLYLPRVPTKDSGICPICRMPLAFADFSEAVQSLAEIDTDHIDPTIERRHVPGNVSFVHHICNTTKGDRSIDEFINWMIGVLERSGYEKITKG